MRLHFRLPSGERRRQLIIGALCALLGLAAGLEAGQPFASRPVGHANVLVLPLAGNAYTNRSGTDTFVDLKTEAQLAFSDAVLSRVEKAEHGRIDAAELRRRVTVKVPGNAEVIVISYRGSTSLGATRMAIQVAKAFIEVRAANAAAAWRARAEVIEAAMTKAEQAFDAASQSGTDPQAVSVLGQRIVSMRSDLRAVTGVPPSPGSVLAASAPRQSQIRKLRVGLLLIGVVGAGALGLVIGRPGRRPPTWLRRLPRIGRPGQRSGRHARLARLRLSADDASEPG